MLALLPILEKNPHKSAKPEYIAMPGEQDNGPSEESSESLYGVNWSRLQPPGPLSLFLWSQDPVYRAGTEAGRRTILNERIVMFQERAQQGQVNGGRRITKKSMSDALGMNIENASEENFEVLERVISCLGNVQWIRMNENEKKITCVPEDLRMWTEDRPILWTRERYRSAGETEAGQVFGLQQLGKWLRDRESEGWSLSFVPAEGTMEELKQQWNSLGIGLPKTKSEKGRILKEDYANALGKLLAYRHLQEARLQVKVE